MSKEESGLRPNENVRMDFNKRFANGEQYMRLVVGNDNAFAIVQECKSYYWQHQEVYNHILPLIEYAMSEKRGNLTDNDLYGENGLVERLIPYQRLYNETMNQRSDRLRYSTYGVCFVEDGSVDVDSLAEEGVAPGSITVYRQGAINPQLMFDTRVGLGYNDILDDCLAQMRQITSDFLEIN